MSSLHLTRFINRRHAKLFKRRRPPTGAADKLKIWIDLDNSPHVPFFLPIIDRLRRRGHEVSVTARDCFQTCELLDLHGQEYVGIGRHYGRNTVLKMGGLFYRAGQMIKFARSQKFSMTVSHGSRSLILSSWLLGIPNVNLFDYEHSKFGGLGRFPAWQLIPEAIPDLLLSRDLDLKRIIRYPGFKEEVYIYSFVPNPSFLSKLGVDPSRIMATLRPPATEAHYHDALAEVLFEKALIRLLERPEVTVVCLPRTADQRRIIERMIAGYPGRVIFPDPVNGLDLVWYSDLVVSGGGTMNREAALLGVPAYSIFSGRPPSVDIELARQNKLTILKDDSDIDDVAIVKRDRARGAPRRQDLARLIADKLIEIASGEGDGLEPDDIHRLTHR